MNGLSGACPTCPFIYSLVRDLIYVYRYLISKQAHNMRRERIVVLIINIKLCVKSFGDKVLTDRKTPIQRKYTKIVWD